MRIAPLTDRTLDAFCRLGHPRGALPAQAVLIEHEGAIVAGAELLQTEGRRGVLLRQPLFVNWISPEMTVKAARAVMKGAEAFASMTGQTCLCLFQAHPLYLGAGWNVTSGNLLVWSPFERQPDQPAQSITSAASSEPPPKPSPEPRPQEQAEPEEDSIDEDLAEPNVAPTPKRRRGKRPASAVNAPDQ